MNKIKDNIDNEYNSVMDDSGLVYALAAALSEQEDLDLSAVETWSAAQMGVVAHNPLYVKVLTCMLKKQTGMSYEKPVVRRLIAGVLSGLKYEPLSQFFHEDKPLTLRRLVTCDGRIDSKDPQYGQRSEVLHKMEQMGEIKIQPDGEVLMIRNSIRDFMTQLLSADFGH